MNRLDLLVCTLGTRGSRPVTMACRLVRTDCKLVRQDCSLVKMENRRGRMGSRRGRWGSKRERWGSRKGRWVNRRGWMDCSLVKMENKKERLGSKRGRLGSKRGRLVSRKGRLVSRRGRWESRRERWESRRERWGNRKGRWGNRRERLVCWVKLDCRKDWLENMPCPHEVSTLETQANTWVTLGSRWERWASSLGKRDYRWGLLVHQEMPENTVDLPESIQDWMGTLGCGEHRVRQGLDSSQDCTRD